MTSSKLSILYLLVSSFILGISNAAQGKDCGFQSLYQFGDSLADVGNFNQILPQNPAASRPYGDTTQALFHKPTGRWSNGLLMIDYIAQELKLPLLTPYLEHGNVEYGVNFAVSGSTVLDNRRLAQSGVFLSVPFANKPLSTQLQWFKEHLNSVCHTPTECTKRLEKALVFVGEIGGNDYNYALRQNKSIADVQGYIPSVVDEITNAVREVIHAGAVRIVVPGNFPMGCIAIIQHVRKLQSKDPRDFDELDCVKSLNKFSRLHNSHLQRSLAGLRKEFPNVIILYANYYKAFESVLRRASSLGFDQSTIFGQCCGTPGPTELGCNTTATVCPNPDRYISWDGVHLTQQAYKYIAEWLLNDILPKLNCSNKIAAPSFPRI